MLLKWKYGIIYFIYHKIKCPILVHGNNWALYVSVIELKIVKRVLGMNQVFIKCFSVNKYVTFIYDLVSFYLKQ